MDGRLTGTTGDALIDRRARYVARAWNALPEGKDSGEEMRKAWELLGRAVVARIAGNDGDEAECLEGAETWAHVALVRNGHTQDTAQRIMADDPSVYDQPAPDYA